MRLPCEAKKFWGQNERFSRKNLVGIIFFPIFATSKSYKRHVEIAATSGIFCARMRGVNEA